MGKAVTREKRYPLRTLLFKAVARDPNPDELTEDYYRGDWWSEHMTGDERFFARVPALEFEGRSVLDYGCGAGHTSVLLAQRGARRVLGVDINGVELARKVTDERFPELAGRVEFRQITGAEDIGDERFDVVVSKGTMEHVAEPERYIQDMASLLAPDGDLVIGFGWPWKSPWGGHIQIMTVMPWAHLLFPEPLIMRERRRYRPDERPTRYEEFVGGLNRMTVGRFRAIMEASGLEATYFATNRNDRLPAKVLAACSRVPGLGEYFTFSVHSVWRKTGASNGRPAQSAGAPRQT
jgi:SAM-dependent methyltransferase